MRLFDDKTSWIPWWKLETFFSWHSRAALATDYRIYKMATCSPHTDYMETKGSLLLRSDSMNYSRAILNSNWWVRSCSWRSQAQADTGPGGVGDRVTGPLWLWLQSLGLEPFTLCRKFLLYSEKGPSDRSHRGTCSGQGPTQRLVLDLITILHSADYTLL